jgi:hypothetical protein
VLREWLRLDRPGPPNRAHGHGAVRFLLHSRERRFRHQTRSRESPGSLYAAEGSDLNLVAYLPYSTTPTPGSLVNFDGGTITNDGYVFDYFAVDHLFAIDGGTITPAVGTPEPASIALLLMAMAVLLVIRKRIGKTEEF